MARCASGFGCEHGAGWASQCEAGGAGVHGGFLAGLLWLSDGARHPTARVTAIAAMEAFEFIMTNDDCSIRAIG
jgi:hypothetical protein